MGHYHARYPVVKGGTSDGREVRKEVPNTSSIGASMDDHTTLKGVRDVPMSDFHSSPHDLFYAKGDHDRVDRLAEQIHRSKEVNPLIVGADKRGPYILEGAHRLGALHKLGAKSFPALVAVDHNWD